MVRIAVVNCAWQLGGDAELLEAVVDQTEADVLAAVECRTKGNKPVPVAKILGPAWATQQKITTGHDSGALAGTVTAVRKDSGIDVRRSKLMLLSHAGHDVQDRYQRLTVVRTPLRNILEIPVWHAPLKSTGRHTEAVHNASEVVDRIRHRRAANPRHRLGVGLGDVNDDPSVWAHQIGWTRHYGIKPMGIFLSGGWGKDVTFTKFEIKGTDHWVLVMEADR